VSVGLRELPSATSAEDRAVMRADLRRALLGLSYQERIVVVLFFYLDLPLSEVADIVGASVTATRSRLYRAVNRLRPGIDVQEAIQ
jgi:RNA polymerase sigma factor (sigma-70 family)